MTRVFHRSRLLFTVVIQDENALVDSRDISTFQRNSIIIPDSRSLIIVSFTGHSSAGQRGLPLASKLLCASGDRLISYRCVR